MKKAILFVGVMILTLFSFSLFAQNNCKVLLTKISDTYTGSCKNGLADGQGEASGMDKYTGEFKKGLPDGDGTYVWKTGDVYTGEWRKGLREGNGKYTFKYMGRDSVLAGIWKNDKYAGTKVLPPYVIEYRNGISRLSVIKVGTRPYLKYKFSLNGDESNSIVNILMQGSSGSETNTTSFTGFEQITFPFKGRLTFSAPNAFRTALMNCELRMVINEPGSWIVTVFY